MSEDSYGAQLIDTEIAQAGSFQVPRSHASICVDGRLAVIFRVQGFGSGPCGVDPLLFMANETGAGSQIPTRSSFMISLVITFIGDISKGTKPFPPRSSGRSNTEDQDHSWKDR